jgi:hypothetical protein
MQLFDILERLLPNAYTAHVLQQSTMASCLLSSVHARFDQLEACIRGSAPVGNAATSVLMASPASVPCAAPANTTGMTAHPQKSPRHVDGSTCPRGTGEHASDGERVVDTRNTQEAAADAAEALSLLGCEVSQDVLSYSQLDLKAIRDQMAGLSQSSLHLSQLQSQPDLAHTFSQDCNANVDMEAQD